MSDNNGTNFVAAEMELRKLTNCSVKNPKFVSTMISKKIKWTFNPPYATHFGGIFKITVIAVMKVIVAILGNSDVAIEELMATVLLLVQKL